MFTICYFSLLCKVVKCIVSRWVSQSGRHLYKILFDILRGECIVTVSQSVRPTTYISFFFGEECIVTASQSVSQADHLYKFIFQGRVYCYCLPRRICLHVGPTQSCRSKRTCLPRYSGSHPITSVKWTSVPRYSGSDPITSVKMDHCPQQSCRKHRMCWKAKISLDLSANSQIVFLANRRNSIIYSYNSLLNEYLTWILNISANTIWMSANMRKLTVILEFVCKNEKIVCKYLTLLES